MLGKLWKFGGFGKELHLIFLTSQLVVETYIKEIDKYGSSHYKFVCCNLEAFGKKVASRPGVAIKPLSSRVKTSKWFQGMMT
jgi:hypothetical protein